MSIGAPPHNPQRNDLLHSPHGAALALEAHLDGLPERIACLPGMDTLASTLAELGRPEAEGDHRPLAALIRALRPKNAGDPKAATDAVEALLHAFPLCQPRVRQLPLDISVPMGGEWCLERAQAFPCSWS